MIQVVPNPLPGVDSALVIGGSDKRGTIYGIYDLSEQIGVSPWYWWADVPAQHQDQLFVKAGRFVQGPPAVKYRGIFLNDEAPDLTQLGPREIRQRVPGMPRRRQLRPRILHEPVRTDSPHSKGNYLWPAMWNNAFNEDDPENPRLADEYGIVMGTSHQEPMLRAQKEWDRSLQQTLRQLELQQHQPAAGAAAILARRHPPQQELRKHHHPRPARRKRQPARPSARS